jgi:hypothetical protein
MLDGEYVHGSYYLGTAPVQIQMERLLSVDMAHLYYA